MDYLIDTTSIYEVLLLMYKENPPSTNLKEDTRKAIINSI